MKYDEEFNCLLANLISRQQRDEEEYKNCPPGSMVQEHRDGNVLLLHAYMTDKGRKRRVINRNEKMISLLARKKYLETEMRVLNKNIKALKRMIAAYVEPTPESVIAMMPEKYKRLPERHMLRPVDDIEIQSVSGGCEDANIMASAEYRRWWARQPYEKSTYEPDDKVQVTSTGLRVRTKSEVIVAEMLDAAGISYRYEQMLHICGFSFAPDFTIMTADRIWYWEHAGKVSDERYLKRHKWKIEMYGKAGIVPWKNLIITYDQENGGLDSRVIRSEIENKLM